MPRRPRTTDTAGEAMYAVHGIVTFGGLALLVLFVVAGIFSDPDSGADERTCVTARQAVEDAHLWAQLEDLPGAPVDEGPTGGTYDALMAVDEHPGCFNEEAAAAAHAALENGNWETGLAQVFAACPVDSHDYVGPHLHC